MPFAADATTAALTAIRAVIIADAAITAIVPAAQVVDRPDANLPLPMIVLGSTSAQTDDTSDTFGQDISIDVGIYTKGPDTAPARAIAGRLRTLFHRQSLPLANVILVEHLATIGPGQSDVQDELQTISTLRVLVGHG
jgi:hypothetical protein